MKRALITGITGQDGSYLAELLLSKGYEVHGIIRRASTFNTSRIDHIYQDPNHPGTRLFLYHGDLCSSEWILNLIYTLLPDEVYHLAAQSHVRVSFDIPEYTGEVTGLGSMRLLEAIRRSGSKTRFYQASSSEMFGSAPPPQNESTVLAPRSPYAAAKLYAHAMTRIYREGYGIFAVNGILFNHESPRRGETFVTRKITRGIAAILAGREDAVYLGNLEARRDWGYAPEYVEAMWRMLQQDSAEDYVVGTGETYSVREFAEAAFRYAGLDWAAHVKVSDRYLRPLEVDVLIADASKARARLGWQPRIGFHDLVAIMVDADLEAAGLPSPGKGKLILQEKMGHWNQWHDSVTRMVQAVDGQATQH
ncbi:MAG TPA: GDP-mannose 4,6-dehydratase [Patescibacteria group bacterium]|nr:GDP-mannose 4,6-dehydratase [Candidatus Solibacter sp.]HVN10256.1 GDP-mannose 4,6-dehydratase [Patescibacteria group bacterium]